MEMSTRDEIFSWIAQFEGISAEMNVGLTSIVVTSDISTIPAFYAAIRALRPIAATGAGAMSYIAGIPTAKNSD